MSIPFKILATLVVLACCAIDCVAQSGCRVDPPSSAGRSNVTLIYYNKQPGESLDGFYSVNGSYALTCPPGASSSVSRAVVQNVSRTQCFVEKKQDGSPYGYPNNYWQNGVIVSFRVEQCPIDDFAPLALLGAAGLGFVVIRRKVR